MRLTIVDGGENVAARGKHQVQIAIVVQIDPKCACRGFEIIDPGQSAFVTKAAIGLLNEQTVGKATRFKFLVLCVDSRWGRPGMRAHCGASSARTCRNAKA